MLMCLEFYDISPLRCNDFKHVLPAKKVYINSIYLDWNNQSECISCKHFVNSSHENQHLVENRKWKVIRLLEHLRNNMSHIANKPV